MQKQTEIRDLFAYNRWATRRIVDAATALDAASFTRDLRGSYPSVRETLVHMWSAEWIWLERWEGTSPTARPDTGSGFDTAPGLRARWEALWREQSAFLDRLDEQALGRELSYTNLAGQSDQQPLWVLLRHVVNHATYHRGQVITMLRQLGTTPPSTDLVLFYRERAAGRLQAAGA